MNKRKLRWLFMGLFVCLMVPLTSLHGQSIELLYAPTSGYTSLGNLLHVAFDPDNNGIGYAVGNCGGFSRSTTDGETWQDMDWEENIDLEQIIVFPQNEGLKAMAFTDFNHYITYDKGESWQEGAFLLPAEEGRITDAFALGPNTAIFATSTGRIYRTEDDGQNWKLHQQQFGELETQCLDFLDAQNGWLGSLDGLLYRTEDGGRNWTIHAQDTFAYHSVDLLNDTLGYCLTNAGAFKLKGSPLTLEKVINWIILFRGNKITAGTENTFTSNDNNFFFLHTIHDDGIISGQPIDTYFSHFRGRRLTQYHGWLWAGGQNKIILTFYPKGSLEIFYPSKPETEEFIKDVYFLNEAQCLASSTTNRVFKVDKESNDWVNFQLTNDLLTKHALLLSDGRLASLVNNRFYILEDNEFRFHSMLPTDRIISFTKDPFRDSCLYLLTSVDRLGTQLYKSTNNGLDWQQIYQSSFRASNLLIPEKDVLFVCKQSQNSNMDRSTDGGATWQVALSKESIQFTDINFYDKDYGILTSNDRLLITKNGGLTFREYPHSGLQNLIFQSNLLVWATKDDEYGTHILRSKDGGQSWENTFYLCDAVQKVRLDPFTGDLWFICTLGNVYTLRNQTSGFYHELGEQAFQIFPNPSDGTVQLSFPREQDIPAESLELYDASGRLIEKHNLEGYALTSFNWSHLSNGAYIIRLIGKNFAETQKLILHK